MPLNTGESLTPGTTVDTPARRLLAKPNAKPPDGRITSEKLGPKDWTALILGTHPGYVTWEQFETNKRVLAAGAGAHARAGTSSPPAKAQPCY